MAFPPIGSTCAEPPPEIMPTSECDPITAMVCSFAALNGSMAFSFFSRTMPPSSILREVSNPANGSMTLRCRG